MFTHDRSWPYTRDLLDRLQIGANILKLMNMLPPCISEIELFQK